MTLGRNPEFNHKVTLESSHHPCMHDNGYNCTSLHCPYDSVMKMSWKCEKDLSFIWLMCVDLMLHVHLCHFTDPPPIREASMLNISLLWGLPPSRPFSLEKLCITSLRLYGLDYICQRLNIL